jgi:hypothetical protein
MSVLADRTGPEAISIGSFDAWPELHGAWYDDPFEKADLRWWDGTRWTENVKAAGDAAPSRVGWQRALRIQATLLAALARL